MQGNARVNHGTKYQRFGVGFLGTFIDALGHLARFFDGIDKGDTHRMKLKLLKLRQYRVTECLGGNPRAVRDDKHGAFSKWIAHRLWEDRKSTRLNSSHVAISYAVFCLQKNNVLRKYGM